MRPAVELVVESSHLDLSDLDEIMSRIPASKMNKSQLKILLAIMEYERLLKEEPAINTTRDFSHEEFTRNLSLSSEPSAKRWKTAHTNRQSGIADVTNNELCGRGIHIKLSTKQV
uniref:Uncharacterized protein n=1 Tax=Ditylenchus dipsaci TaxID=166011 RepID=A0A915CZ30_9BILA